MTRQTKIKRFENVEIQFVNLSDAGSERATVLLRGEDMVIDIQSPDDQITDYLIVGKPVDYYFKGRNSASGDAPKVVAMWTRLGQSYVGEWIEDGVEYLFSFELRD